MDVAKLDIRGVDARTIDTVAKSMIAHFIKRYGNIEEIRKAFSSNRNEWRDNLMKQEKNMIRVINETPAHQDAKMLIADAILDLSERLVVLAHKDIVNQDKKVDENHVVNIINTLINSFDLEDRKRFWMDTFEKQNEFVFDVLNSNLGRDIDMRAAKVLIMYADIMMLKVEKNKSIAEKVAEFLNKINENRKTKKIDPKECLNLCVQDDSPRPAISRKFNFEMVKSEKNLFFLVPNNLKNVIM